MKIPIKMSNQNIIMFIIVIAIIGYYMYSTKENMIELQYYFSPNCPHCVKFMPIWETIQIPTRKRKINCDKENCQGIESLPTIIFKNGSEKLEFNEDRTKDAIEMFVNKHL